MVDTLLNAMLVSATGGFVIGIMTGVGIMLKHFQRKIDTAKKKQESTK